MKRTRETSYKLYVDDAIRTMVEAGYSFTLEELSVKTGMKVTASFRRRVKEWVKRGSLMVKRVDVAGGGSHNRYWVPTPL